MSLCTCRPLLDSTYLNVRRGSISTVVERQGSIFQVEFWVAWFSQVHGLFPPSTRISNPSFSFFSRHID
jgi:hypothetical protein